MGLVDVTLSHLMALQAKQKPQVLHRNKRYVEPHKNGRNTCAFSLVFALFIPSDKNQLVARAILRVQYRISSENIF